MTRGNGAPRRATDAPAGHAARCGLRWHARDMARQARLQPILRPYLTAGASLVTFSVMVVAGSLLAPPDQRDGPGEYWICGAIFTVGALLCARRRRWRR